MKRTGLSFLVSGLLLSGCLASVEVDVSGEAFSPTFTFEEEVAVVELAVRRYCLDAQGRTHFHTKWAIEAEGTPEGLAQIRYGETPEGYLGLDAAAALEVNQLYSVEAHGLGTTSVGLFLLEQRSGDVEIVNIGQGLTKFLEENRGVYGVTC